MSDFEIELNDRHLKFPRFEHGEWIVHGERWVNTDGTYWLCRCLRRFFRQAKHYRFRCDPVPDVSHYPTKLRYTHAGAHLFNNLRRSYDEQCLSYEDETQGELQFTPKAKHISGYDHWDGKRSVKTSMRSWKTSKLKKQWMHRLPNPKT